MARSSNPEQETSADEMGAAERGLEADWQLTEKDRRRSTNRGSSTGRVARVCGESQIGFLIFSAFLESLRRLHFPGLAEKLHDRQAGRQGQAQRGASFDRQPHQAVLSAGEDLLGRG